MKIFYFTSTGNSLKMAQTLNKQIKDSQIIAIKDIIDIANFSISDDKVGFVFPVYVYGLPRIVERFIRNIDLSKVMYIFGVATAMFPNGFALSQLDMLLYNKNKKLNYGRYIKMPTNYVTAFSPLNPTKCNRLIHRADKTAIKIATDIDKMKNRIQRESKIYQMITNAKSHYTSWAHHVSKSDANFVVHDTCISCGICEKVCPVNNIKMKNGKPTFRNTCEQCYGCINHCPKQSITYDKILKGSYIHPDISLNQIIGETDKKI